MKKIIPCLFALASVVNPTAEIKLASDEQILKELNEKFIHNFVTNDTISHSKIIHADFVCISSAGQYVNRQEYLQNWLHGFDGFRYWDYRDERITVFGNTALVHAANKYIVQKEGKEITGMSVYTDVYLKENGEWKCVQAQISRVAPEFYPNEDTIVKKYDYRK
jgi:ketosteroid isomerase-like protein